MTALQYAFWPGSQIIGLNQDKDDGPGMIVLSIVLDNVSINK
jgi:hypothetical protein